MVPSGSTASRSALLIGGVATSTLVALLLLKRASSCRNRSLEEDDDQEQVELLEIEKTLYKVDTDATSTITWFQGDCMAASAILMARLQRILEANRWLTGRVVKRNGKLLLAHSRRSQTVVVDDFCHVVSPDKSQISRDTPLDQLGPAATKAGFVVTNGPSQSLFQVTIVPCATRPQTYFGVIVSMSHIVADGFTFYTIHNMLCSDETVEQLVVERIANTTQLQINVMGRKEYSYLSSAGFIASNIIGAIQSKLFPDSRVQSRCVLINPDAMAETKRLALASSTSDDLPFISTNDVLTSWFLQNTLCRYGLLVVNWRGRLPGHTRLHAGNYENVLFYCRADSETPSLIRQSLSHRRRIVTPDYMPSFWERATGSTAIVTNWASFAKPNVIHGCVEEFHVPLYDIASVLPSTLATCCIFRAGPQGIALFLAGTTKTLDALLQHDAPFVSDKIVC